jgi:hypothetical protein
VTEIIIVGRHEGHDSPVSLATRISELFPLFARELEAKRSLPIIRLSSVNACGHEYLHTATAQTVREFCNMINGMVAAVGDRENAIQRAC